LAAMGPIAATVNAGPDGSFLIKPGLSYQLAGVVTDYGKPDGKTILWTTASGPGGAEAAFADPSSPTSTVTFPVAGAYTLKLTVIDDVGTVEDTVVITTTTPTCADVVAAGLTQKTDLNKDCYVNLKDLAILLENWTQCNDPEDEDCIWPF
ncbi:MAG: PKD domain-containing protein, partial [Phycisphaerae bacterium]|nr:PKD domain-containing protein [Phycisphaerae bacterium]